MLLVALGACTHARACAVSDPDPAPVDPPPCEGEACTSIAGYCAILLATCDPYRAIEADAGTAQCESLVLARFAGIGELARAAHELWACAQADGGCAASNCVEAVRAKYISDPDDTDAGPAVTVRNASALPGDRMQCVRCAHEQCAELAAPCFGEFDAAVPPADSCFAYRACLRACTTGFGLTLEQSKCAVTECDRAFDAGRAQFDLYRRCMLAVDHCRGCGTPSFDGGSGGPR